MRKITGLSIASAITAAIIISGIGPATAAPEATAPPSVSSSISPTPAATVPATAPAIVPAMLPATTAPSATANEATPPAAEQAATPATTAPAESPAETATPTHQPFGSVATSPPEGTALPLAAPLAAPLAGVANPFAAPAANDAFVGQVITAINGYRIANGARQLAISRSIGAGSQQWAANLNGQINANTLDLNNVHRPDAGASILPQGYDMYSEVIAINGTPQQVVDWWMGSPSHRAAILDKRATDLGLGYVKSTQAGWGGMTTVVGNLAGYPDSRNPQPQPLPQPNSAAVVTAGDVAAVDAAGSLYIYPSAKGGDLWQRKFVSDGWSGAQQLVVTDYNGDGRQDLVAVWKDGRLTVSYGQSNGTFAPISAIGHGWAPFDIVVTAWRSGDKLPSILAKQRVTGELSLYPNLDGARFGTQTRIGTGWGPLTIMGSDFDGDGRQDLLARNAAGQLLLYRGTGNGGFISEARRVVGTGWGAMTHLSGISGHVRTGSQGILARTSAGNLLHYPMVKNGWGTPTQIGSGGWGPLLLGS